MLGLEKKRMMNQTDNKLLEYLAEHMADRFDKLERKVDRLWELKMMLIGGCLVISAVCSVFINILLVYLKVH